MTRLTEFLLVDESHLFKSIKIGQKFWHKTAQYLRIETVQQKAKGSQNHGDGNYVNAVRMDSGALEHFQADTRVEPHKEAYVKIEDVEPGNCIHYQGDLYRVHARIKEDRVVIRGLFGDKQLQYGAAVREVKQVTVELY